MIIRPDEIKTIYKELAPVVYRYTRFKLGNTEEAEDATSETFLRFIKLAEEQEIENSKAFALGIARNVVYETYRKRPHLKDLDSDMADVSEEAINLNIMEETTLSKILVEKIKDLITKLDEVTQEIISLRIWEELQFSEIAQIVELKDSTVKLRFYRGIEKLKQLAQKDQKLKVVAFPAFLFGIYQVKNLPELKASSSFLSNTSNLINSQIKKPNMKANINISKSFGIKLVAISLATVAVVASVAIIATNLVTNLNKEPLVPVDTARITEEIPLTEEDLPFTIETSPDTEAKIIDNCFSTPTVQEDVEVRICSDKLGYSPSLYTGTVGGEYPQSGVVFILDRYYPFQYAVIGGKTKIFEVWPQPVETNTGILYVALGYFGKDKDIYENLNIGREAFEQATSILSTLKLKDVRAPGKAVEFSLRDFGGQNEKRLETIAPEGTLIEEIPVEAAGSNANKIIATFPSGTKLTIDTVIEGYGQSYGLFELPNELGTFYRNEVSQAENIYSYVNDASLSHQCVVGGGSTELIEAPCGNGLYILGSSNRYTIICEGEDVASCDRFMTNLKSQD